MTPLLAPPLPKPLSVAPDTEGLTSLLEALHAMPERTDAERRPPPPLAVLGTSLTTDQLSELIDGLREGLPRPAVRLPLCWWG